MRLFLLMPLLALGACAEPAPDSAPEGPMDEVPAQQVRHDGAREYRFTNGCVILLEPAQAVVRSEGEVCALYQRDIALLYASGD